MKKLTSVLAICMLLISTDCFAQAGTLDSSFGENGKVISDNDNVEPFSVAIQADQKIVVSSCNIWNGGFGASRYYPDGSIDSSFSHDGHVHIDFDNLHRDYSMTLKPDGKILEAGCTSDGHFAFVQFKPDGNLDPAFGDSGYIVSDFEVWPFSNIPVALQTDGKIVAAGVGGQGIQVIRCYQEGTPDSSFGKNGHTSVGINSFHCGTIAIQPDEKIVVAGSSYLNGTFNFLILRFNADGSVDSAFGDNGRINDFDNSDYQKVCVAVQTDAKIVVAGTISNGLNLDIAVARYNSNGTPDSSFGQNGKIVTDINNSDNPVSSIALQPDGKILIASWSGDFFTATDFVLVRYDSGGQLDKNFGQNGITLNDFSNYDLSIAVALQQEGKIILAGSTGKYDFSEETHITLARYNNDEVLPVSIVNLKAYSVGSSVKIDWTALNELNISLYNIERSVDAKNFITLGNVKGKNNGQQKIDYSYIDQVRAGSVNFYRIKSVSRDGAVKYTNTVKVNIANTEPSIVISPNPAKDILYITGLSCSTQTISLLDLQGKLVQQSTTANSSYSFNVKQLSAGIYFIRIDERDKSTTLKFIKE